MNMYEQRDRLTKAQANQKLQLWSENFQRRFDGNVYHYTSVSALSGILSSRAIYCSDYRQLNDTTELRTGLEVLESVIAARAEDAGIAISDVNDALEHLARLREAPFHISMYTASFSIQGNDLTQWRAYAPRHGVSIGFNLQALKRIAEEQNFVCGAVRYLGAPFFNEFLFEQLEAMKNGLAETAKNEAQLREQASNEPPDHVDLLIAHQRSGNLERWIAEVAALLKNPDFRSEAEWRCVFVHRQNTIQPQKPTHFRSSGTNVVRFTNLDLSQVDLNQLISKIFIGPGVGREETYELASDLVRQAGLHAEVMLPSHAVR